MAWLALSICSLAFRKSFSQIRKICLPTLFKKFLVAANLKDNCSGLVLLSSTLNIIHNILKWLRAKKSKQ